MKKIFFLLAVTLMLLSFGITRIPVYKGFSLKTFEKSFAEIPADVFVYGLADVDPVPPGMPEGAKTVETELFYMSKYEVSNGQYLEFLKEIRKEDYQLYLKMLPDTLVWKGLFYPYYDVESTFFRHPVYNFNPVVGVSYEQAEEYCRWITKRYMKEKKRKYKNVVFKLPTSIQWYIAATGGYDMTIFPWPDLSMQDKDGEWRANFKQIDQGSIMRVNYPYTDFTGELKSFILYAGVEERGHFMDDSNPTKSIRAYEPNEYGLYNMAGNVEEYMREKGITKGGSWNDTGYYLQMLVEEKYDSTNYVSAERGFRIVMEIVE